MKRSFSFAHSHPIFHTSFIQKFKMEGKTLFKIAAVVLNEFMDSDNGKLCRGKTRQWGKRGMKEAILITL